MSTHAYWSRYGGDGFLCGVSVYPLQYWLLVLCEYECMGSRELFRTGLNTFLDSFCREFVFTPERICIHL